MALTKEELKQWITALRSGDYKQTTAGTLKQRFEDGSVGYCCLGVLESIQGREPEAAVEEGGSLFQGPTEVYERLDSTVSTDYVTTDKLVSKNDGGESFEAIADYLENHYYG